MSAQANDKSDLVVAYDEAGITIYNAPCEPVMAGMADGSIDLVVTSPPYNMGLTPGGNGRGMYRPSASRKAGRFREGYDGGHADVMAQDDYDAWQRSCLAEMWRVARLGVFYNHRPRIEHGQVRLPLSMDFGGLPLRQVITWDRGTGIDVNLRHFCTVGEWILFFAKPDTKLSSHSASGMGDVWRLGMAHGVDHPAPFPVSLPARCIEATGATSVLDPFMGSGTTLRAAKDAGIRGIGIDRSERYCDVARDRLRQGSIFGDFG